MVIQIEKNVTIFLGWVETIKQRTSWRAYPPNQSWRVRLPRWRRNYLVRRQTWRGPRSRHLQWYSRYRKMLSWPIAPYSFCTNRTSWDCCPIWPSKRNRCCYPGHGVATRGRGFERLLEHHFFKSKNPWMFVLYRFIYRFILFYCLVKFCADVWAFPNVERNPIPSRKVGCETIGGSVKLQNQLGGSFQYAKGVLQCQ